MVPFIAGIWIISLVFGSAEPFLTTLAYASYKKVNVTSTNCPKPKEQTQMMVAIDQESLGLLTPDDLKEIGIDPTFLDSLRDDMEMKNRKQQSRPRRQAPCFINSFSGQIIVQNNNADDVKRRSDWCSFYINESYLEYTTMALTIFSFIFIAICYGNIFKEIHRSKDRVSTRKNVRKLVMTTVMLLGAYSIW